MAEALTRTKGVSLGSEAHNFARAPFPVKTKEILGIEASIVDLVPRLRAFARSLTRSHAAADDLLQETFVRALGHIDQFCPGTNLKAWIFAIMRNTYISQGKRSSRETRMFRPADCEAVAGSWAPQSWSSASQVVAKALSQLPPDQRETVVLISCLGLSYEECAETCGCAIGTVKSRLNRGREGLRRILEAETADDLV
ncbi:sigma-70 family RNA polymerase sigma factor [Methylopila sp. Yamaguchi]|uniref:sigma-70 family RNA polymerase sigma factor n=1 Tax=Methylopila sp. Yamaguchi TaxID=1437817 RepID=UPI000CAC4B8C|nr:sigma-70 family RNA polymerase sigma factor [Methylopila sp. Yamaguchi]GBD49617.1 RNA polymerase sigma factor [Methylopila sp. Yamaguchi]